MKTFCEVCTANPATLVCCADDAVICGSCDMSIHSANPVVAKHERVAFAPTARPMCDICQANPVVVVCHEDRAFLCRTCDVQIHSANDFVAKHARFLFSGVGLKLNSVGASAAASGSGAPSAVADQTQRAREVALAHLKPSEPYYFSGGNGNGSNQQQNNTTSNNTNTTRAGGKGGKRRKTTSDGYDDDEAVVPSSGGPSSSGGSGGAARNGASHFAADDEFNSFVADFVKGGAQADADFLDTFFDDIPAGFREEDFGVVPTFR